MIPKTRRRLSSFLVPAAIVLVLPLLAWVAVQVGRSDNEAGQAAPMSAEPGVAHVHGLGLNPADDSRYVATHYGTCPNVAHRGSRPAAI